ncbi:MAG: NAD(P)/FAD-dependent oxidoreductase [bacterium]
MYDVIIIGAGPAGLTAAANTSHRGLKSLVFDKQATPGGLPMLVYPDKIIRDHPGFPIGILARELSRMLVMQARNAGAEIRCDEEVLKIDKKDENLIEVKTTQDVYQAKRVIVCTGTYNVPKKLDVLKSYTGPNVHYRVEVPARFRGKQVVIVGGGDHAFDTAIQLSDTAGSTTVLVKEKYAKAKEHTVKLAESAGIKVLYNTTPVKIFKNRSGLLQSILVTNLETGETENIRAEELFVAIGFEPIKRFLESNGFIVQEDGSIKVGRDLQTNIKGIFAAGDITGEIRLIATACAEGITAAVHAFEEIKKPYWLR